MSEALTRYISCSNDDSLWPNFGVRNLLFFQKNLETILLPWLQSPNLAKVFKKG